MAAAPARRRLARRVAVETAWLAGFILIPALIAVYARESLPSGLRYGSSAEDVVRTWTVADPASFVRYGRYLLSRDAWDVAATGCWPPGMGAINAALFATVGESRFVLKTMILSVVLWGVALYGVWRTLTYPRGMLARFAVVNSIWLFASFRYWLLITASIFSESKALPLFVLGVALFVRGLQTRRDGYYVASGIVLALAAYVRAVFDATILVGFAGVAGIAVGRLGVGALVDGLRSSRVPSARDLRGFVVQPAAATARHALRIAAVVLVTAVILLAPWKLRNLAVLGEFSLRVCAGDYVKYWSYDMPSYLIAGDAGCKANPDLCAIVNAQIASLTPDLGRRLTLFAVVFSPRAYFAHKLRHFPEFWVGTPWRLLGTRNNGLLIEGLISLAAGAIGLGWALRTAWTLRGPRAIFAAFFLGVCLQNLVVFTLLHYEYRYSAPLRLFFFFSPWWMASLDTAPAEAAT